MSLANGFSRGRTALALAAALALALGARRAMTQTVVYTHTSGPVGDGFTWDADFSTGLNDLPAGDSFFTPDEGVYYGNYTENVTYFDANYQAAGNSSHIHGDAWWGNPYDTGYTEVVLGFHGTSNGGVDSLGFDFAWAIAGDDAPDYIELYLWDYGGGPEEEDLETYYYFDLDETFNAGPAFGGFDGRAGRIDIDAFDLYDDFTGEPFTAIEDVYIYLGDIATLGGTGEFAIDNVTLNGGGFSGPAEVYPSFEDGGDEITAYSTRYLRDPAATANIGQFIVNNSGGPTTYSVALDGSSDPEYQAQPPVSGQPLAGQTSDYVQIASLSLGEQSGSYSGSYTVANDGDPSDPDDTVSFSYDIYDAPQLTANNGANPLNATSTPLTIANAPAGPHAGALRAGVEITAVSVSGPLTLSGFEVDAFVGPGDAIAATVDFNRYGRRTGAYHGSATVDLQMNSAAGSFLNGAEPVPSETWQIRYDHGNVLSDSATLAAAESYNQQVGVNTTLSAATLVGGSSPGAQSVQMDVVANPGGGATLATDAVDLDFSAANGLFVLQFTYDPGSLPFGLAEQDVRMLWFDENAGLWASAIDGNSDGGAGGAFFSGSFADYLSGPGGGILDGSDLSDFGVDAANNTAWAVLDHASTFAAGSLLALFAAGDFDENGLVDGADLARWQGGFGVTGSATHGQGDADGDLNVNGNDLLTWQRQFGLGQPVAAGQVPEPGTISLGVVGALLVWSGRRERARRLAL